ncbi:MAG TPA: class I SAM-dependent methyltransferase [Thermoanaerobaculia bacterium]|nr:class I SAM-dependent methyltransferase [Thermoanaerobaculia bacterium]
MSRPSATAALVVRGIAFQARHPRHGHLVPPAAAELSQRFVRAAGLGVRRGDSLLDRMLVAIQERLFVPGLTLQYVMRKRRIEQIVREELARGTAQLVVLGAGFDTLALRLSEEVPRLRAIEVDRGETQAGKRAAAGTGRRVVFVAAELGSESLREKLEECGAFDGNAPAIFLAEAVFLYLTPAHIHHTLAEIRAVSPPATVVFTFFEERRLQANFRNATLLADLWLMWKREPGRWAIDPAEIGRFAGEDGFRLVRLIRDHEYHEGLPAARGEHIAVVEAG